MTARGRRIGLSRFVGLTVLLGLFVLLDLGLFGWLLFRSLSQKEIERVLLETRKEAEGLAQRIEEQAEAEGRDLYTAVAVERETQSYVDSILSQREIVQTVEVRDHDGRLVMRADTDTVLFEDGAPVKLENREVPPHLSQQTHERESTYYDVKVPIGELGFVQIGISRNEMERRIASLREELVGKTVLTGASTVALIAVAALLITYLWRRGRQLEEQAEEAERLAYVGTLASGLAHEIRSPLNALSLNMQLLEEEVGPGRGRKLFSITRDEIGRLDRLVGDFLSYARPRAAERREIPVAELIERARDLLAPQLARQGVLLRLVDESEGARVEVDPGQWNQLLLNLVQNAVAATEETGRRPEVSVRASRSGQEVTLEVTDNGVGIDPADRERVFEAFYSTRKGGTGLGLAVVRRIAAAHDARVELESSVGEGTTVRVVLATAREETGEERGTGRPRSARLASGDPIA
ncbi:MAG: ATP-binding protein [Thermoanaerobaculia bacterium]